MIILMFLVLLGRTAGIQIPSIANVSLVSTYPTNATTMTNVSCHQCLCANHNFNASAINCFESNRSCQFFSSFPRTYQIQSSRQTRLYFPRRTLPGPSRCCASNWTYLMRRLSNATTISVNITKPRCLAIDNHNYLVTVEDRGNLLSRFHPNNLTLVDQTYFPGGTFMNIVYFRSAYYISRNDQTVLIVDSNSLTVVNIITSPIIQGPRDILFLRNGQVLVLASAGNNQLLFFQRSINASTPNSYQYAYSCSTSYLWPHGLWYVNDSFFYATSWHADAIISYSVNSNFTCRERIYINAWPITNGSNSGSHLTIDQCGRSWFSIADIGLLAFDNQGSFLGNFSRITSGLFDMLLTDTYVMFLSDNLAGRILRLDPRITC